MTKVSDKIMGLATQCDRIGAVSASYQPPYLSDAGERPYLYDAKMSDTKGPQ